MTTRTSNRTTNTKTSRAQPARPGKLPRGSWTAILKRSIREMKDDDLTDRSAALTYYGVLALFPALLVVVSVLGLLGESTTQKVLDNLGQATPGDVNDFLRNVVSQVQGRAGAASIAAIVGLAIALWSASGYVAAFMRAANVIYDIDEGRPVWRTATVRLLTTIGLVIMLVVAAAIVVLTGPIATQVGDAIGVGNGIVLAWDIAKWPVLVVLVGGMLTLLYKSTPNVKQPGFKWASPGVAIAVLVWMIGSGAFAVYVGFSGSYNKTYGSLATVIIFLVWLWLTNTAILLGAEVNAEVQRERAIQAGLPANVEPFTEARDVRKLDADQRERVEKANRIRRRLFHRAPN
ncbi:MAG TPA: YihY/virulence factor BrkB family protein [Jatrophihabitans sp.]|jgi:membrane protein|nr:YihY/virulence factor BrkB family protein [Jatrophihabitans sp.]